MASNQSFFGQARSVGTVYLDREGDYLADVRFCLARHGEDASLVIERFWEEQPSSGFTVVPLFAHGLPPRRQLSTAKSITAALESVSLEPGSMLEKQWREVADGLGAKWPTPLQQEEAA
jgi:hypothetical protein